MHEDISASEFEDVLFNQPGFERILEADPDNDEPNYIEDLRTGDGTCTEVRDSIGSLLDIFVEHEDFGESVSDLLTGVITTLAAPNDWFTGKLTRFYRNYSIDTTVTPDVRLSRLHDYARLKGLTDLSTDELIEHYTRAYYFDSGYPASMPHRLLLTLANCIVSTCDRIRPAHDDPEHSFQSFGLDSHPTPLNPGVPCIAYLPEED